MTCIGVESGNVATGSGTLTAHTLTAKGARQVYVWTVEEGTGNPTGVTYDGAAMTNVVSFSRLAGGNTIYLSLWVINQTALPAAAGSYNVVSSGGSPGRTGLTILELNNVAQVTPAGAQLTTDTEPDVMTNTISATAFECGETVALGFIGIGASGSTFNNPPTGTGTWTRLNQQAAPPTGARQGSSFQVFTASGGSKSHTETSVAGWIRAGHLLAMVQQAQSNPMMGANF